MTTVFVTYPGAASTRFDRKYYVEQHLPLVNKVWGPHGLENIAAFFPGSDGSGTIAVCLCEFRDELALSTSLQDPETKAVMNDVQHFTDAKPVQLKASAL